MVACHQLERYAFALDNLRHSLALSTGRHPIPPFAWNGGLVLKIHAQCQGYHNFFTTADKEGKTLRNERKGVNFTFNLTSMSSTSLVSAMKVITNISVTTVINNATVHCGDETTPHAVLLVQRGSL